MTKKFISVQDCDINFYNCIECKDWENASAYYESLKYHYQLRGKKIKYLLKRIEILESLKVSAVIFILAVIAYIILTTWR